MKKHPFLLLFTVWALMASAQTDSLAVPKQNLKPQKIAAARHELLNSFLMNDPAGAELWIDSLSKIEDSTYAGLVWDERWMLRYWTESYGTLLEEVSRFDENQRALESWKIPPAKDSLFQWLDYTLYERRFDLFNSIQNGFLNSEEKAFTTILLEYLLRLNKDEEEWASKLESFENHYANSRFLPLIRSIKPRILKPSSMGYGISGGLITSDWRKNLERSLQPLYGFHADLYFWSKRWNYLIDFTAGGPDVARDIPQGKDIWPKKDHTSFIMAGFHVGYDLLNNKNLRVFPSVGGAIGSLKPPTPSEDEDPLPDYYVNFEYFEIHFSAAITTDVKLFKKNYRNWNTPKGSYQGIRLKFGWNALNFGHKNEALKGGMFFFAVNYNLFAFIPKNE